MLYTIDREDLNNTFVTADNHFGHANIIKFCNRPFESAEQMDRAMIDNWNKIVGPEDVIFHLGDFTLGGIDDACKYFEPLNGRIQILANHWHHDRRWMPKKYFGPAVLEYGEAKYQKALKNIEILPPIVVLEVPGLGRDSHPLAITLCHYPLAVWDRKHYGAIHCHGHSHGNYKYSADDYAIDVGVDCMNFYPISLGNVLGLMYERGWID